MSRERSDTADGGSMGSDGIGREDPDVAEPYRKDPEDERFLEKLNAILGDVQEEEYEDLPERQPTVHVVGVPRSGTTLLYQLIASYLPVGYVNNLIAAFWRAPVYGIRLSKKLLGFGPPSSLESEFGRTAGIHEPHEFGYFWSDLLGYETMEQRGAAFEAAIDWDRVARVLTNMTHAFGAPIAFKSFQLGWHIERMQRVLPRTCFVWIRRDPVQNALSLLEMRRRFLGSVDRWASFRPREYEELRERPVPDQVAGQVYHLERSIADQVEKVGGRNVVQVRYEELCRDPGAVLREVRDLLARNGLGGEQIVDAPSELTLRVRAPGGAPEYGAVRQAVAELYGENAHEAEGRQ